MLLQGGHRSPVQNNAWRGEDGQTQSVGGLSGGTGECRRFEFSGGVDSTFLLKIAHDVLGERVLAVTAQSPAFPHRELAGRSVLSERGIRHSILDAEELRIDGFAQNPPNRCYLCKRELLVKIHAPSPEMASHTSPRARMWMMTGTTAPVLEAVKRLLCVKSPLRAVGLSKQEIRDCSRQVGLNMGQTLVCLPVLPFSLR